MSYIGSLSKSNCPRYESMHNKVAWRRAIRQGFACVFLISKFDFDRSATVDACIITSLLLWVGKRTFSPFER